MIAQLVIAGLLLVAIGQAGLWLARWGAEPGKHSVRRLAKHDGWEGREDELHEFTVAFLVEKHSVHEEQVEPRWPDTDLDTQEFPAVLPSVLPSVTDYWARRLSGVGS